MKFPLPIPNPARCFAQRAGILLVSAIVASVSLPAHASGRRHSASPAGPDVPSFGQLGGLRTTSDSLGLKSSVALVLDQETNEVLFSKNPLAVLPIASLTKLMTALVVTDANQPANEVLTITDDDVDYVKHSHSRLAVGTKLTRGEMLHLTLMASENRAAHALARAYPGGIVAFVEAMNQKAVGLGMRETRYVEPTGLSSMNQSSASNLAMLVRAAHERAVIRELSTSDQSMVGVGRRMMRFRSTNLLIRNHRWDIGLQKTGYITEAGRCMVLQAKLAGRQVVMVLLDSAGGRARSDDAERLRAMLTRTFAQREALAATQTQGPVSGAAASQVIPKMVAGS